MCWGAGHSFASCRGRRCHVRSCTDLSAGAPVAAYGHALYGNHWKQRRPSLSVGNLSKVVALHGRPAMLQSSAAVHGGNSGGMLLNPEGTVLGMVTSNVRHTPPPSSADDMATRKAKEKESEEGGALLVELNFSMPLVALEELLAMAGLFDDRSGLEGAVDSDGDDGKAAAATSAGRRRAVSDHEFMDLEMQAELDSPDEQVCAEIDYRSYWCGWRQWDRQKCRIVGKSQSVLIMINPIIFTRTRIRLCVQGLCLVRDSAAASAKPLTACTAPLLCLAAGGAVGPQPRAGAGVPGQGGAASGWAPLPKVHGGVSGAAGRRTAAADGGGGGGPCGCCGCQREPRGRGAARAGRSSQHAAEVGRAGSCGPHARTAVAACIFRGNRASVGGVTVTAITLSLPITRERDVLPAIAARGHSSLAYLVRRRSDRCREAAASALVAASKAALPRLDQWCARHLGEP
eukprot:SAG25_NODE_62_length_17948_cov_8.453975_8_plen_459_part_00